jgi:ABC-2 type transport system ATP-binding protein
LSADLAVITDRLTRLFVDVTAVSEVSLSVAEGELFGLVGPDGAGKTTILRMLAGVLSPSAGDARIFGVSVASQAERVKRDIAYMPQRFGLYQDLTVLENLLFYADLYLVPAAERPTRLERLFEFSQLGTFRDRLAGKLSGGMKQKLGLSCALISQPRLLLLDEPTFGVDPISRRDLWLIIHGMVAEGAAAVVSTAYMDEAERFDRVALLHGGAVAALDSPDALREGLQGRMLEVAAEPIRRAQDVARRHPAVQQAALFGDRLHVTVDSAEREAQSLREALAAEGVDVAQVAPIEPSMEDVFLARMPRGESA